MAPPSVVMTVMQHQLPLILVFTGIALYTLGYLVIQYFKTEKASAKSFPPVKLDQAEKGDVIRQQELAEGDRFELEKRAFLSKTWLFVCHRSRFDKIGDYHTLSIAGISVFVVLGKDSQLRAFHNVCRHRAYTVVRKSCGTSTRFSCKYHGWQYDDRGSLVKAPQFDQSPGFNPEQNGLYEVKLLLTQEGLVFVNFDASTAGIPFNNVRSKLNMGTCIWLKGFDVAMSIDWKRIARDFSDQAQWSKSTFPWLPSFRRRQNKIRLLGPLSLLRELDENLWCTITLLPMSAAKTEVRCDIYIGEGAVAPKAVLDKWQFVLRKELEAVEGSSTESGSASLSGFEYECGGRTIDLAAILTQHQRIEQLAKKRLQPAIRIAGQEDVDQEASAICDALDGVEPGKSSQSCSPFGEFRQRLEW